ncbi:hypothetical protein FZC83_02120 [Rossellomorea marisflavi]|uniref:Prophage helix-turn-helix protein n=1 Tax=Rossellomorea marisflavi TaxID=189381 RepID=A0A5D4S3E7_9BACI|nr:AimR family lysis-lysogeny pheromone receptor [Rossellomorea marisflavi]TYS56392.1 hypothetical protein FZC83_02120 [Rossellomorea marisflavi]
MGRLSLQKMILNKFEEDTGLATKMAKIAGYSSPGALTKILKDEKKEFAKFYGLVKIVRCMFFEEEKSLMAEYSTTLDPNKQTARYMLEYLNTSNLHDEKKKLINRMLESSNALSKEYANIYEIDHNSLMKLEDFNGTLSKYLSLNNKTIEGKVITEILKCYTFLDEHEYTMIKRSLDTVSKLVHEIKDDYLREILLCRYSLLLVGYHVRNDEKMKVRDICWSLINQVEDNYFKSWAYLHIGNSYIIEDYDKSYKYLTDGLKLNSDNNNAVMNLKRSVNFVSNLWGKESLLLDLNSENPSDKHEIAFYYIQHGQKQMALNTLDSLEFDKLTVNQKAFHMYYRGLLNYDLDSFAESVAYFRESGDFFFRKLPLLEISKMEVPSSIIRALAK